MIAGVVAQHDKIRSRGYTTAAIFANGEGRCNDIVTSGSNA